MASFYSARWARLSCGPFVAIQQSSSRVRYAHADPESRTLTNVIEQEAPGEQCLDS